jgi:SAM-dependent methyltransferase
MQMNEKSATYTENYTQTRYSLDSKRTLVWKVFVPFLQKKFHIQGHVLDVGCGFGDFINHIQTSQKSALDANPEMKKFLDPSIEFKGGFTSDLKTAFKAKDFDWIFSSNLLEHLTREQVTDFFNDCKNLLKPGGSLLIFMPNYRFCSNEYFDDYTHLTPISDRSLCDWLRACGYKIDFVHPRFMPFSVKDSKLPITSWLVKLWLLSPFKPGGKQMLIKASRAE